MTFIKKIGFIDYYVSEWHANNYPEWIKAASEKMGDDFAVAYAWAELDVSPEDGVSTEEDLKITGGGRSLEEYIIHQIEMAVKVEGKGASLVSLKKKCGTVKIEISYPDTRRATLSYRNSNAFSTDGKQIKSPFFVNLISDILHFYNTGKAPFDTEETLEVIKIRDAVLALENAGGTLAI